MTIEELQLQISKQEAKLATLEQAPSQEVVYNDGGEVKYRTVHNASNLEIEKLRTEILAMKNELAAKKIAKIANSEQKSSVNSSQAEDLKAAAEKEKMEEDYRKVTFKRVKDIYNSQSFVKKVTNKISGRAPKWGKIKELSQEELDFLINLSKGVTQRQVESNRQRTESYENKGLSFKEIEKRIIDNNMSSFNQGLTEQNYLDSAMNLENGGKSL